MVGKALIIFFSAIAVLGAIGFLLAKKHPDEATRDDTENVVDLNDRFNRARYMNKDGE